MADIPYGDDIPTWIVYRDVDAMTDWQTIFGELFSTFDEIHYFEGGFFIGFISGWLIYAYIHRHGYGLKVKNWIRKRKINKRLKLYRSRE